LVRCSEMTQFKAPLPIACGACPYRQDAPSGLWAKEQYEVLPPYDADMPDQPPAAFLCHEQNGHLCAGWVGCHKGDQLLGVMVAAAMGLLSPDEFQLVLTYRPHPDVPLFKSATEAAEHGLRDIAKPSPRAQTMARQLLSKEAPIAPRYLGDFEIKHPLPRRWR
jgi:hypothetical protein